MLKARTSGQVGGAAGSGVLRRRGGGALSPTSPLAGYALWLNPSYRPGTAFQDAARTIPANLGDPVGGLTDPTTGITATATSTARPTLSATGMTFAGAQWLTHTGLALAAYTVYVVAVKSASTTSRYFIGGTPFSGLLAANQLGWFDGTTVRIGDASTGVAVWTVTSAGQIYRNGTQIATGAAFTGVTLTTIGRRGDGAFPFDAEIREVLLYAGAHDLATRTAEIAKAMARTGVTP